MKYILVIFCLLITASFFNDGIYDIELPPIHIYNLKKDTYTTEQITYAIIKHESRFNSQAIGYNKNGSRDLGIAQFNERYLNWYKNQYGEFDPFVPGEAIPVAIKHIESLKDRLGCWDAAIQAYNIGEAAFLNGKRAAEYLNKVKEFL